MRRVRRYRLGGEKRRYLIRAVAAATAAAAARRPLCCPGGGAEPSLSFGSGDWVVRVKLHGVERAGVCVCSLNAVSANKPLLVF